MYHHPHHIHINGVNRHFGGWKKDLPDHRDRSFKLHDKNLVTPLPSKSIVPYTDVIKVLDQGNLGSCVAHGTLFCMGYLLLHLGKSYNQLSRLFTYYMTRVRYEFVDPSEDSGCQVRSAIKCLNALGSCKETLWPYDETTYMIKPNAGATKEASTHQLLAYSRIDGLAQLKAAIAKGFAVVGGFTCYESIDSAYTNSTGVISLPKNDETTVGGHCVAFIGYDDEKKLIRFRNSWSDNWGDHGDGYLPYDFITSGLADDLWIITAEEI
jgi:C1A family cysteine protease